MRSYLWCFFLCFLFVSPPLSAQSLSDKALESEIMRMDSLLFDVAFNQCDLALYQKIVTADLEFYDDRSGLNTSFERELQSITEKCDKPFSVSRKLVNSSVHRLGEYGAMQKGEHIFLVDDHVVEAASFITVWERKGDTWIMKRAISYDHRSME